MAVAAMTAAGVDPKSHPHESAPPELSRNERTGIRKLVKVLYANYDQKNGCLPLGCDCVMHHKCYTGGGGKYFRDSVLPTDTALEALLAHGAAACCRGGQGKYRLPAGHNRQG